MGTVRRTVGKLIAGLVALLLFGVLAVGAGADDSSTPPAPSLASDSATYTPGETVTLSGANWTGGQLVHLHVAAGGEGGWSRDVDVVVAADGTISDSFDLPADLAADFGAVATGPLGESATTSFTSAFAAPAAPPTIVSDKADYAPGETVTLTGAGWQAGEQVHLVVNDDDSQSWSHAADVTADSSGGFAYQFELPAYFVANYGVTATGSVSGSATATFTDAVSTTTTMTSDPNPSDRGEAVTFTATVVFTSGGAPVTGAGSLAFVDYGIGTGNANCTGSAATLASGLTLDSSGQASFTTSALTSGTHNIRACYTNPGAGSSAPGGSTSAPYEQTVRPGAPAKLAFTVQPSADLIDIPLTPAVEVTVQDADGTTVTTSTAAITLGFGANPGGATLSGNSENAVAGVAAFSNLSLDRAANGYTLTASSPGLTGATSTAFNITKRATSTTVSCLPAPVGIGTGNSSTCTATVTDTSAGTKSAPTGTVNWTTSGGSSFSPTSCTLSAATASSSTCSAVLTVTTTGNKNAAAAYQGDTKHNTSNGNQTVVGNNLPNTTLTVAPASGTSGGSATFTATLRNAATSAAVSGKSIAFTRNGTSVGSATTNGSGVATLSVSLVGISAGTYPGGVGATFAGDSGFNASSGSNTLTVNPACTAPSVTDDPDDATVTYGSDAAFTAAASGDPTPTVQWQVKVGGGTFTNLAGEISTTLTVVKPAVSQSGNQYRAVVTNTCDGTQTATTTAATLTVNAKSITVTPDSGQSKVYGEDDPTLTFAHAPALEDGDVFTGALRRASGENAGSYAIDLGTLSAGLNYSLSPAAGTVNFTIKKAPQTVTFTSNAPSGAVYGDVYKPTATGGASDNPVAFAASGACFYDGSTGEVRMNGVGTCAVTADQDGNGNYEAADQATQSFSVGKAPTTTTVTCEAGPFTYTGSAIEPCTALVTGPGNLDESLAVDYTANTGAGTAHAAASYAESAHYLGSSDEQTFEIGKAEAVISVTPYDVTFDGDAHTADGSATGVQGEDLSSLLDLSGTTHTDAGDYSGDAWSFSGDDNYEADAGTVDDAIAKADAVIVVTAYSVTYDGDSHTASGTATGVKGGNLSDLLDLSGTTHIGAGDYPADAWSFAGNENYNEDSGTVHDEIGKAEAVISVTPYDVTFDGDAHTATGSATGVQGESLSSLLDLSGTTHSDAGDYPDDAWTFAGDDNYEADAGTVHDKVAKADAVIVVTPYDVIYNGEAHTASGTATGVKGGDLSSLLNLSGTTHIGAGDYPGDAWTFAGNNNYNEDAGTVQDKIGKADADCTVSGYTGAYDGSAHGAGGSCLGVGGSPVSGLDLGGTFTNVPGGSASWSFSNANYQDESDSVGIVIDKANAAVVITWATPQTYDGSAHPASAQVNGVGGETNLTPAATLTYYPGADTSGTALSGAPTNAGEYTVKAEFAGNDNYKDASNTKTITIAKADTSTGVVSSQSPSSYGNAVTFTATVSGFLGAPEGTVKFFDGGTSCTDSGAVQLGATQTLNGSGQASVTTSALSAASHTIRACYQGTGNYKTSGESVTQSVTPPPYAVQYLQPIDQSTSTLIKNNATKAGRVVPIKVQILLGSVPQSDTVLGASPTIQVLQRSTCAADATDTVEQYADAAGASNSGGSAFRWSATDGFWIYNLDTKASGLATSKCYRVNVVLNGSVISTSTFAVLQMVK